MRLPRHSRTLTACGVAALIAAAGATHLASNAQGDSGTTSSHIATFSDSGVTVTVDVNVKDRSATRATLATTFAPDRPGFHLYSIDLPANGIQGVGRPISVVAQGALHTTGPLVADAAVTQLPLTGTSLSLPVYPDGPVTVYLPIAIDRTGEATLLVGYAACSSKACLPPVSSHPVHLAVSDSAIAERGA